MKDPSDSPVQLKLQEELQERNQKHSHEIEQLYERIFCGPTPEFPEEDEAENAVFALERQCKELRSRVERMREASELLGEAATHASYAVRALETAVSRVFVRIGPFIISYEAEKVCYSACRDIKAA